MGFFTTILEKLGMAEAAAAPVITPPAAAPAAKAANPVATAPARKALAQELYCPDELMNDSAKMNMWLHRNVLAHVAANGGSIPKELLD